STARIGARIASRFGLEVSVGWVPYVAGGQRTDAFLWTGEAVLPLTDGVLGTYLAAGGGVYTALDTREDEGAVPRAQWGFGLRARASGDIWLRADARHVISTGFGDRDVAHIGELTVGVEFHLWDVTRIDRDGDGVADIDDPCPSERGDPEMNGCPDRDGDGRPDNEDHCPNAPASTADGCPAEMVGDERCPDGRFKTSTGCALVRATCSMIEIAEPIAFEENSTRPTAMARLVLDEIARLLADHPEIEEIRIEGHTDNRGDRGTNLRVSAERARSVRDYLVDQGIARWRLHWRGFGERWPVASNDSAEGRARNRRVELRIIAAAERPGCR
ncbi:MAG: OmpA family protein, partial [Myxococcales bacterium]|nr:OmpA family protein [Myxococcales bacterium]